MNHNETMTDEMKDATPQETPAVDAAKQTQTDLGAVMSGGGVAGDGAFATVRLAGADGGGDGLAPRPMSGPVAESIDPWKLVEEMRRRIASMSERMPEWRDCRHRLPDTDETVLLYCPDAVEQVWLGFYDGTHWRSTDCTRLREDVTHWMEPPDSPEAE